MREDILKNLGLTEAVLIRLNLRQMEINLRRCRRRPL